MSDFTDRIKRRKLGQWALAYAGAAWLVLQLLSLMTQPFAWPDLVMRAAFVVLAVGFIAVLILAWFHGEKGQQRASGIELMMLAVLCVVAAVGVMLVSKRGEDRPADIGAPTETLVQTAMGASQVSIAVLPFENMSADPDNAYFADGITEDVLTNLAKIGSLKVVSRTSIMRYKGSNKSVAEIARELGVAHVLEGSVRRAGDRVRIVAQLIRAGQDDHLWAETYDRDVKDIFAVQTEIARAIADALSAKLTTSDVNKAAAGQTAVVGAYELHLRGREMARNASDTTDVNRAIVLFRRALELDPKFALAEASLSEAMRRRGKRDSAFAAARRAIKLAPNAAEGYAALAGAYRVGGQFREALVEARTAVELNPNNAAAIGEIGYMTGELGGLDDALPWMKRAVALEPTTPGLRGNLGSLYLQMGAYDEAEREFRELLNMDPGSIGAFDDLGFTALSRGRRAEAEAWADSLNRDRSRRTQASLRWEMGDLAPMERVLQTDSVARHGSHSTEWAYILQQRGKREEAARFLDLAEKLAHKRISEGDQVRAPQFILSRVYALRGDRVQALRTIRVWIDHGLRDPNELIYEPMFSSLHNDPEFLRIVEDMKQHQAKLRERAKREGWW